MRYALGLVVWLLATSGLLAADQTKSKSTSGTPGPIQLGILVGGKAWDMADFSPDKTDQGFQTAALYTRADEPIIGILLTNPNNYDFEYTCVYRDSLLDNDKTETVKAGQPCPSIPHNTQSLYVKSLSAKFTSEPAGQIKISCALFDPGTPPYTPPPLPLPHSAPPVPPPLTPSCVTATDTQRIVGVQIAVRAPPMLQLGVLAPPGKSGISLIRCPTSLTRSSKQSSVTRRQTGRLLASS
jgi:hypothetical protein